MAGIDITSLFADVLPNPQRQLEERTLQQSDAVNQANAVSQLGGMAAYLAPQRGRAMAAAGKGLLGIPQTTTPADAVKAQLAAASSQQQTPESLIRLANLVQNTDPEKAAGFRAAATEMQKEQATLVTQRTTDTAIITQAQQRIIAAAAEGTSLEKTAAANQARQLPALFAEDPVKAREYVLRLEEELREDQNRIDVAGATAGRQRDDEIASRVAELTRGGMTGPLVQETAAQIVDGVLRVELQEDGSLYQINDAMAASADPEVRKRAVTRLRPDDPVATITDLNPYDLPKGQSLMEAAELGTGIVNMFSEGLGRWVANFAPSALAEDRTAAVNVLKGADNLLIRAFALNPRYPVAEQERIRENYGINPKLGEPPAAMQVKIQNLDKFVERESAMLVRRINDPTSDDLSRLADKSTLAELKAFRGILFPSEYKAPIIQTLNDVVNLTRDELQRYIEDPNTTEDVFSKLPEEVRQAILNGL